MTQNNALSRRTLLGVMGFAAVATPIQVFAATPIEVKAWRNPGCGCCEKWAGQMQDAGFAVTMQDDARLEARKASLGVPTDLAGCHTAQIGPYVIEGHVPPDDIILFLAEKPQALGLAVPGMPMGSPGMEMDGMQDAYDVIQFGQNNARKVYAHHG